jgi:hypothetical protein
MLLVTFKHSTKFPIAYPYSVSVIENNRQWVKDYKSPQRRASAVRQAFAITALFPEEW